VEGGPRGVAPFATGVASTPVFGVMGWGRAAWTRRRSSLDHFIAPSLHRARFGMLDIKLFGLKTLAWQRKLTH